MICYKKNSDADKSYLSLSLIKTRPGVLKDLKTMGSVSLFIFFVTLLVLARQVSVLFKAELHLLIYRLKQLMVIIMLFAYCMCACSQKEEMLLLP